ncbi:MAG TPA: hypothetical protein PLN85_01020 [archaeon]|jgi:uncharacterized membrane-anchored protein YhcB (DUF1043 family)|nr:hypothetical protein [archaeon]
MGNIIEDIFEDVDIKPKKSKVVIKWIIRISIFLITTAFIVGKLTIKHQNRLNIIEKKIENNKFEIENNKKEIIKTNEKMECNFDKLNNKYDKLNNRFDNFLIFQNYENKKK